MYEEASQVANDAVGSIRTVASFCAEDRVMEWYKKKCRGPIKTGIRQGLISGIGFGTALFLLFSVYACSFYTGARLVEQDKATFSDVFRVTVSISPPTRRTISLDPCLNVFSILIRFDLCRFSLLSRWPPSALLSRALSSLMLPKQGPLLPQYLKFSMGNRR